MNRDVVSGNLVVINHDNINSEYAHYAHLVPGSSACELGSACAPAMSSAAWATAATRASRVARRGQMMPKLVERELDGYVGCGVLARGFARVRLNRFRAPLSRHQAQDRHQPTCRQRGFLRLHNTPR